MNVFRKWSGCQPCFLHAVKKEWTGKTVRNVLDILFSPSSGERFLPSWNACVPVSSAGACFNETAQRKRPGFRRKYSHSGKFYGIEPTSYSPKPHDFPQADMDALPPVTSLTQKREGMFWDTGSLRHPRFESSSLKTGFYGTVDKEMIFVKECFEKYYFRLKLSRG